MIFSRLFSQTGRIGRGSFWRLISLFVVVYFMAVMTALFMVEMLGGSVSTDWDTSLSGAVFVLFVLAVWIAIVTSVKRLHDLNRSGWWMLLGLIPTIGALILFVWLGLNEGIEADNRFGPANNGSPFRKDRDASVMLRPNQKPPI